MNDKKKILLIKSPFRGISHVLLDLYKGAGNNFDFYELRYSGDKPIKEDFRTRYDPEHFYLEPDCIAPNKNSVISLRFGSLIVDAGLYTHNFSVDNGEVVVSGDLRHRDAVEKVSNLVYSKIDGVLPVWSEGVGGFGFMLAMSNQKMFFNKLRDECKPELYVGPGSVQDITPIRALDKWMEDMDSVEKVI